MYTMVTMPKNKIIIRIDRYPDLYRRVRRIMADYDIDTYAELLNLLVTAFEDNPIYFIKYKARRGMQFIGLDK